MGLLSSGPNALSHSQHTKGLFSGVDCFVFLQTLDVTPRVHNSTVLKRLLKKLLELLQYYWYCIAIDIAGIISKILISTLKLQLGKYHIDIEVDIEDNKFDYQ